MHTFRTCSDLDSEIATLVAEGYRLDMIMPADAPHEARLSKAGEQIELHIDPQSQIPHPKSPGRAGMRYRDLIPDRVGGRVIASHIRIERGGAVPDYVHYHKIGFQIIFSKAGWIRVVYEDQGEPFVLEPGDCVLQPPGIRHRVLEASEGAEVVEVSSPAEHETWVEHELILPTRIPNRDRLFGNQKFVRHVAKDAVWNNKEDFDVAETAIAAATNGIASMRIFRAAANAVITQESDNAFVFLFVLAGRMKIETAVGMTAVLEADDCHWLIDQSRYSVHAIERAEFLEVIIRNL